MSSVVKWTDGTIGSNLLWNQIWLGAIFISSKGLGVGGWFRKWLFFLTLCNESVLTKVVLKSPKTSLRNIKMVPYSLIPEINPVKVWVFWEVHKIWKNLCCTFDKSVVFCVCNSVLVKKSTKIFKNKCGQVVLYKL